MDSPADDDNSNFEKNDQQLFFHYWLKFFFADIDWIGRDDNCCWGTKKMPLKKEEQEAILRLTFLLRSLVWKKIYTHLSEWVCMYSINTIYKNMTRKGTKKN